MQGPPGTGKTSTIVAIVSALLGIAPAQQQPVGSASPGAAGGRRVLVCAQSNAAVDELALRLSNGVRDAASGKPRCAHAGVAGELWLILLCLKRCKISYNWGRCLWRLVGGCSTPKIGYFSLQTSSA